MRGKIKYAFLGLGLLNTYMIILTAVYGRILLSISLLCTLLAISRWAAWRNLAEEAIEQFKYYSSL